MPQMVGVYLDLVATLVIFQLNGFVVVLLSLSILRIIDEDIFYVPKMYKMNGLKTEKFSQNI